MIPLVSSVFKNKQTNLEPLNLSSAFEHRESPQKSSVRGVVLGKLDCWLHYYAAATGGGEQGLRSRGLSPHRPLPGPWRHLSVPSLHYLACPTLSPGVHP